MKNSVELKVNVDASEATKKIERANCAAIALKKALDDLKQIDIAINVVRKGSKRWYQFWK